MGVTWCKIQCTDFRGTVYERSVESSIISPTASAKSNVEIPYERGSGDASSSTAFEELTQTPEDVNHGFEDISSLVYMPAGRNVLDLINWAKNTILLNEVSTNMLKCMCFMIYIAKFLMSCSPFSAYTKDDREKILDATIDAIIVDSIGQHEGQDNKSPKFIDIFREVCRQHPDDEYLTALVNCVVKQLREVTYAEEEETNAALADWKLYLTAS
ncbi:uncharacterized protein N7479_005338 [Penicillium vulpinum]|uniref:Uncharacterized protein n=1 Tax=Penicillium vulpinum TaxID=29845 RepID=A0A1V6RK68_9EURO|nr:uncharacterized protein N7479_005338 [Penicillium vulpinum]KAJ5958188.1 hypothetical protein N7479_005338 [Penicillium vulpinum]OQE02185.1 hypothetical protein PENVUL_c040G08666 [Penicillium vulpinum]